MDNSGGTGQRTPAEVVAEIEVLLVRCENAVEWPADEIEYLRRARDRPGYDAAEFAGLPGWKDAVDRARNLARLRTRKVLALAEEHTEAVHRERVLSGLLVVAAPSGRVHYARPDGRVEAGAYESLCNPDIYGRIALWPRPDELVLICDGCRAEVSRNLGNGHTEPAWTRPNEPTPER